MSFPFVVPKESGESRFIIDYSHLRGSYCKPPLKLPSFPAILHSLAPIKKGDFLARIDLKSAFSAVPIPQRLKHVSIYCWNNTTFEFQVLPMVLYLSPAILQAVVQEVVYLVFPSVLRKDESFVWVHLDDILIAGKSLVNVKAKV